MIENNEESAVASITAAAMTVNVRQGTNWMLLILSCILLSIGNCGGPLIMRFYFINGGNRIWLISFLQFAGYPFVLFLLLLHFPHRRYASIDRTRVITNMNARLFVMATIMGAFLGLHNHFYVYGISRLPTSTFSLIIASGLPFIAVFAYFLVKQKFTRYSIVAVVFMTIGVVIPWLHRNSDRPEGESIKEYTLGFVITVLATLLYGFFLPLIILVTYNKSKCSITYTLLFQILTVVYVFALIFSTVGMIVNNDFKVILREAATFRLGQTIYFTILCATALIEQCCFLGTIGVVYCSSSFLSEIIIVVLLPIIELLAVLFYKENFRPDKAVALVAFLIGFGFYFYGEYVTGKQEDATSSSQQSTELVV